MDDERNNRRLPPPAFPPGTRKKVVHRNSTSARPARPLRRGVEDAFISPDDPFPPRLDTVEHALILPDDPLPERPARDALREAFISPEEPLPSRHSLGEAPEEGIVTGIGSDPHLDPGELASAGDPHVMEVAEAVGKLAAALKRKGEAGLRTSPEMSRFEATLRAYCVGYLAGRRAEAEPDFLDWGEAIPEDA